MTVFQSSNYHASQPNYLIPTTNQKPQSKKKGEKDRFRLNVGKITYGQGIRLYNNNNNNENRKKEGEKKYPRIGSH